MKKSFEGRHYKSLKTIKLQVEDGFISDILEIEDSETGYIVAPGLVDLQVNGFQGIDFNEEGLVEADVVAVTRKLWEVGVTTYFPTLITSKRSNISHSIRAIVKACASDPLVNKSIGGIHLEGPFLSREEGPRGAHPINYIQAPDWELFCGWQHEAEGRIKLMTMAPEWEGAAEFIDKCAASGVKVALGHTAANSYQIKQAVQAGASLSTHLGNAAHLMLPRHPNYIWDQLASEELWTSLIADGFHLPEEVIKVFLRVKPETTFLVSDSTKFTGLPPGIYQSPIGGTVELASNGRLFLVENPGLLAGSASSLLSCINHLFLSKLATLQDAIDMASEKPREYLGLKPPTIPDLNFESKTDLIVFALKNGKINVLQTIKEGEIVFSAFD